MIALPRLTNSSPSLYYRTECQSGESSKKRRCLAASGLIFVLLIMLCQLSWPEQLNHNKILLKPSKFGSLNRLRVSKSSAWSQYIHSDPIVIDDLQPEFDDVSLAHIDEHVRDVDESGDQETKNHQILTTKPNFGSKK